MSNEQQRYDYPNYNGQNSPYQRNMNNPNSNNPNMNNRNMNNPNMNNFNMNNQNMNNFNMNNPNMNNFNMNNRNMNNFNSNGPNMNRFNMNGPNMNRPRPARKEWGLVHRFNVTADNDTDTKPSNNSNENDRINNTSTENRSFEPPPSPNRNNPQQNYNSSISQQNNDDQNDFYQSNRNKYSSYQGNQYEDSFANNHNPPNYGRDNFRSNEQDRGRNSHYSNESDYNRRYHDDRRYDDRHDNRDSRRYDDRYDRDNRHFDDRRDDRDSRNNRRFDERYDDRDNRRYDDRYDDRDNRRYDDRYDDRRYNDRDNFRQPYKQDRHHLHDDHDSYNDRSRHGDRNDSHNDRGRREDDYSIRRYPSSSTNSASISSSSSSNIQRSNSLPKNKPIIPNSASPKNSPSPIQYLPSSDSDIEDIDKDSFNSSGKEHKKKINTSSLVTRQEVVDQPNNISELPDSIKKLTQGNKEVAPVKEQQVNKDITIISKPKKKVALISPSSSTLSSHNIFNEIDSKPKSHVEGLTPIKKKTPLNYSSVFEKGISPFPEIKKSGKDKLYESFNKNANVIDWIELKLSVVNNNQNNLNNDNKISENFDDLDFTEFLHEFHFDEDILRRNDWQKNPESLIKRISESELDLHKNNEPIESFIVKDKDDPYYYDTNLFTLKPVMTESEKITNLLSKYNLPDVSDYIKDQISTIEEDIQKSIKYLNK